MDKNRKTAFDALLEIETRGAYSNIAVNRAVEKNNPDEEAFVRNIVYGVLENQIYLDYRISQLIKMKLKKLRPQVLILLRMGAYQIEFSDSVPSYAAISESVAIAKKVCRGLDGFVNGVLRSYDRKNGEFTMPDAVINPALHLAVKYSYKEDIADMWIKMFGFERAESIMKAGNSAPPLTIRVNTLRTDAEKLRKELENEGFEVSKIITGNSEYDEILSGMALNVSGSGLLSTDLYRQGMFSVQDISSMIAVSMLSPEPGNRVIDICAAPGGKSLCAAELMNDTGSIISCDIHEHKVKLMKDAAERLGVKCMTAVQNDATVFRREFKESADCVIVDAPCSGLGVVRRKPEIKLHTSVKEVKDLAEIQLKILETASEYVAEKGRLIYSTCTVSEYENQGVLDMFLKKNKKFFKTCETQLLPDSDSSDGFYFSVIQRF